jgi:hypothetical protein
MGWLGTTICISIAKMWAAKIECSSFYFRRPDETVSRISELAKGARVGEMMIVLADSLGIALKTATREALKPFVLRRRAL